MKHVHEQRLYNLVKRLENEATYVLPRTDNNSPEQQSSLVRLAGLAAELDIAVKLALKEACTI